MSRIFIENLPKNISENELRKRFGEKGQITDVQLKKEKRVAFIGYKTNDSAAEAIEYFNKTFINSSRISVKKAEGFRTNKFDHEQVKKSKDKKKHPRDSGEGDDDDDDDDDNNSDRESGERKKQPKEKFDPFEDVKDDPDFQEFLAVQRNVDLGKGKEIWKDDGMKVGNDDDDNDDDDDEYDGNGAENDDEKNTGSDEAEDDDNDNNNNNNNGQKRVKKRGNKKNKVTFDFTVKLSGLPYKVKKRQLKDFFAPLSLKSLRFVPKVRGIAYVSFKSEADLTQALVKHRGFIDGHRIEIAKHSTGNAGPAAPAPNNSKNSNVSGSTTQKNQEKWKNIENAEPIGESGRLYIRNLSYACTEDDLKGHFERFGTLTETFMPVDSYTKKPKGFAFITFMFPEHAVAAFNALDKTDFQGRLLHILPAHSKEDKDGSGKRNPDSGIPVQEAGGEDSSIDGPAAGKRSEFKEKRKEEKKKSAQNPVNWNTLFIRPNAVADIMTKKLEINKAELLTQTSKQDNVAVRMALGETQIVNEVRQFLIKNGISLEAFSQGMDCERSKTVILAKNLPAETREDEIYELFKRYGMVNRIILPPYGLTAIIDMADSGEAKFAFKKLAYTNFKHHPLYLEWAPNDVFAPGASDNNNNYNNNNQQANDEDTKNAGQEDGDEIVEENSTIFVKNINFKTINEDLKVHFSKIGKVHSVNIAMKKSGSALLSMGYGFVEYYKHDDAVNAIKRLQNSVLHDHQLELTLSNRNVNRPEVDTNSMAVRKAPEVIQQTGSKICVKNIPFEATERDIQQIFGVYGQLKSVRAPKKLTGTGHFRGFAFVDYVSKEEAKRAFEALRFSTHLYGRKLVLEWAKEELDPNQSNTTEDARKAGKKMARYFDDNGSSTKRLKKSELRHAAK